MTAAAEAAEAALRDLASGQDDRTDTARLRDVYPAVEAALAAGVSHMAVHSTLVQQGYAMSYPSYRSALHRMRNKAKAQGAPAPSIVQAPRPTTTHEVAHNVNEKLSSKQLRQRLADEYVSEAAMNPVLRNKV